MRYGNGIKHDFSEQNWDAIHSRALSWHPSRNLLAGQIDLCFVTTEQLPLWRDGSINAYAVTSDTRLTIAPDIPTFAELGLPALSISGWSGLFAPKGTPRDVIGKLNAAAVEALSDPAVRSRLADLGYEFSLSLIPPPVAVKPRRRPHRSKLR